MSGRFAFILVFVISSLLVFSSIGDVVSASTGVLGQEDHMSVWDRMRQWQLDLFYGDGVVTFDVFHEVMSADDEISLIVILDDFDDIDDLSDEFDIDDDYRDLGNTTDGYPRFVVDVDPDEVARGFWSGLLSGTDLIADSSYVREIRLNREIKIVDDVIDDYDGTHDELMSPDEIGVTTSDIRSHLGVDDYNMTGRNVSIGVLDTGIDYDGMIDGQRAYNETRVSYDSSVSGSDGIDSQGHGSHVSSIIAGNRIETEIDDYEVIVEGIANRSHLYSIQVLGSDGSGTEADIMEGVDMAVEHGVDIISMSLGGMISPFSALYDSVNYARSEGVVVIAAAGNNAGSVPLAPAVWHAAISVGSCTIDGRLSFFSNTRFDVMATGHDVTAPAIRNDDFGIVTMSGTSMATPVVTGVVALLMENDPTLKGDPAGVRDAIVDFGSYGNPVDPEPFVSGWLRTWDDYYYDFPRINYMNLIERDREEDIDRDHSLTHGSVDRWRFAGYNP